MRNKPYREGDRLIEFVTSEVFIFLSLHVVYFVLSTREARANSRMVSFALPIMKSL